MKLQTNILTKERPTALLLINHVMKHIISKIIKIFLEYFLNVKINILRKSLKPINIKHCTKKNVIKSARICGFGHIY